jgi:alkylation response protein AidB-like acyl-CoA dehydrogenase
MENAAELSVPASGALLAREERLLAEARRICASVIEPVAEAVDQAGKTPRANLQALADAGLVGITTPVEWGGLGCSGAFLREFTETLTASCGTTWFVLTQHLGSCGQVANSTNSSLRERFLAKMAAGQHYVGVGFGHLRRPQPMLRATAVPGGWELDGVAPWVTGYPILSGIIFGAVLDDRHLYVYTEAQESETLRSSPPLPLCAMNASETTEVHLTRHFVPEENFVRYSSRVELAEGDRKNIAANVAPPLGCAVGSVRVLRRVAEKRPLPAISTAADALTAEIDACRTEARRWAESDKNAPDYEENALRVRAWAIDLGVRAAHAAIAASSGGANSLTHPAQRRFREAMFYTLAAQTGEIMAATLERLTVLPFKG